MAVNYNDKRFTQVNNEKAVALKENETTYNNMINNSDKYYQAQIDASKDWANTQTQLQNEQTDFAIEKIEQQKKQAHDDYIKEQSGAYHDWQKQSNRYGVNAEQRASQGMANGGYAESSQVAMYTAYQNRVATARESYNRAVLNYDNAMKDARLQNKSVLAEIAYNSLQQQLELSLQGFQYKNTLVLQKAQTKREIDNTYYSRYQDVLNQINTENALAESKRQHDETLKFQREQFNWQKEQAKKNNVSGGGSSGGSGGGSGGQVKGNNQQVNNKNTVSSKAVIDLGRGPISDAEVKRLVNKGLVEVDVENKTLKNTPAGAIQLAQKKNSNPANKYKNLAKNSQSGLSGSFKWENKQKKK